MQRYSNLNVTSGDYAGWDDAYAFMQDRNPKFISNSLGEAFYSKLRLNLFCMIANDGRIVFTRANDYINNVQLPFPPSFLPHLTPGSLLLKHESPKSSVAGFISLPEGLLMVASRPILTTEYKGPSRGTLIIGRFLGHDEMLRMSNLLGYKVEVINAASNVKNRLFRDTLLHLSGRDHVHLQTTQDERNISHVQLADIYGQVAGLVKLEKSSNIYHEAKRTAWSMVLLYCSLCLTITVIYLMLRKKLVIVHRSEQVIKNQLYSFIELAVDGIFSINGNGYLLKVNSKACDMTGYSVAELLTMRFGPLFEAETPGEQVIEQLLSKDGSNSIEKVLRRKDGRHIYVELTSKKMPDGTLQCFMRDVSVRKTMEQERLDFQAHMNNMAIEVSLAEERERNRIAGELHDQVGPNLLLGALKIDQLQARLSDASYDSEFEAAKKFITQAIGDIRSLTFQLRPPILASAGLEAALKWLAQDYEQLYGIHVKVQHGATSIPLEYGVRVTLFHAVRELLLNVVKHAAARHVTITIAKNPDMLDVTVEDDGAGFPVSEDNSTHSNSFGLFNIQQKINYLGGQMHIESSPGHGARISITVPYGTDTAD
jgi:PAS domain S-box-containing protein